MRQTVVLCCLACCVHVAMASEPRDTAVAQRPVSENMLKALFAHSAHYATAIDEYQAEIYMKGIVTSLRRNVLIKLVPSMYRFNHGVKEYIKETVSEMHYTAPDIYDYKVKAVSGTLPRNNKGDLTEALDVLAMNIYSPSFMADKLFSPISGDARKYYTYTYMPNDSMPGTVRIFFTPRFISTQLVDGYVDVFVTGWRVKTLYMEGQYDVVRYKLTVEMGIQHNENLLPKHINVEMLFKLMGNKVRFNADYWMNYRLVKFYMDGGEQRKSQRKHHHDLTPFYNQTIDTTALVTDLHAMEQQRPLALSGQESQLYEEWAERRLHRQQRDGKTRSQRFWGNVGDVLVTRYSVNLHGMGNLRCSPLLNPIMLHYNRSNGWSYRQKVKYNRLMDSGQWLRLVPQVGYNFTYRELYVKFNGSYLYWPEKMGSVDLQFGTGNRIHNSTVVDQLKDRPDVRNLFQKDDLEYFKDMYVDLFHTVEPVNGLELKAGVSMHHRILSSRNLPTSASEWSALTGIRRQYNSFAPRVRLEWTPGNYYYMAGRRKVNVGSKLPTVTVDYERGLKHAFGNNDAHERFEMDVQQKVDLGCLSFFSYRAGWGLFSRTPGVYFIDYVHFRRHSLPEGWNDDIGGTFQLLDRQWYNASQRYLRANATIEAPFIFLRPLSKLVRQVQKERLYFGVLSTPQLRPYVEFGYGIGTHLFDVGVFVSNINGNFGEVGLKFTFELFQD